MLKPVLMSELNVYIPVTNLMFLLLKQTRATFDYPISIIRFAMKRNKIHADTMSEQFESFDHIGRQQKGRFDNKLQNVSSWYRRASAR